jgi:hypothetical protein
MTIDRCCTQNVLISKGAKDVRVSSNGCCHRAGAGLVDQVLEVGDKSRGA